MESEDGPRVRIPGKALILFSGITVTTVVGYMCLYVPIYIALYLVTNVALYIYQYLYHAAKERGILALNQDNDNTTCWQQ